MDSCQPPNLPQCLPRMRTQDFDYNLPPELIAQEPAPARDQSRLMVVTRRTVAIEHRKFSDLPGYLRAGDVLVLNNSKVIPARMRAVNAVTGGEFELLLLEENAPNDWWVMLRPGKRARVHTQLILKDSVGRPSGARATVLETNAEGHRRLQFSADRNILELLAELGEVPLPPYIERTKGSHAVQDRERYQTVYAQPPGSVAAPTAGLHFTESLLERITSLGIRVCFVTLHVGLGTFAPVKAEELSHHVMHEERFELSADTASSVNEAKAGGRRVIAVGTTTLRVLESVASQGQSQLTAGAGRTRLFVYPPYQFRVVDALVTNFHLPRSTLLMLVSAFVSPGQTEGRERLLAAYAEAVRQRYRFFSYGDAMLLL